ncbi:nucleotide excision repair endonuclease [Paenibacillus sp. FSL H8-0457]|uniref:nucleotide excision repair endonuclease n=1 Tax=Paenibacillus TaxID=44249 RepID=UPI0001788FBD|nr:MULTISPECIES: nucleotide excision repair endonuclease [Paenibacillus]ACX68387.1 Excinuclease ABC C subunit domain protein [Paenibacillus sp. Y412MC10]ETT69319.1 Excinuclease ABC subunit C domain-containing protein [Paenibacillus sp. FSL H8-457]PCL91238.1 nucleotide excision repair endonuclease [Paenibacillus lautus]GIP07262.1 nucleotide excision repair endonuclease [Paenibacillus lautus]
MIDITIPKPDVTITKQDAPELSHIYGFTDFHLIPRDRGGIFMFYNSKEELLFVGKARKLRPRIKKHFEDSVSPIKEHRNEVTSIEVCVIEDAVHREIYETYIINEFKAKYNVDKVFFR